MSAPADLHALACLCGQETEGIPSGLGSTGTTPLVVELLHRGLEITLFTLSHGLAKETVHDLWPLRLFAGSVREYGASRNFYRPEIAYRSCVINREKPALSTRIGPTNLRSAPWQRESPPSRPYMVFPGTYCATFAIVAVLSGC